MKTKNTLLYLSISNIKILWRFLTPRKKDLNKEKERK